MISPFAGLTKAQITKLYKLLEVHTYKYKSGKKILPTIRHDNIIGIILNGYVQIINTEYNGNEIVKENLYKDYIFGSNISLTNSEDCQILAKEDTEVLVIDYNRLISSKNFSHNYFNIFFKNIFLIINEKLKDNSERIKILEKKQIRERLLEFFDIEYKKTHSNKIFLKITFKELADYLGVNRSAMFRELKSLKEEKFIKIDNNKITLLYK